MHARPSIAKIAGPLAQRLLNAGVTPDMVTVAGTVCVVAGSLGLIARGTMFIGTLVVTLSVLTDMLDGTMARLRGTSSRWGAFLDSTMDRIADGAIFSAVAIWYAGGEDHSRLLVGLALWCLVMGAVTSYAKARAESLGMTCNVGFAERAERLIILLVGTGLHDLGVLPFALGVLAVASGVTVVQRLVEVHRQASLPA